MTTRPYTEEAHALLMAMAKAVCTRDTWGLMRANVVEAYDAALKAEAKHGDQIVSEDELLANLQTPPAFTVSEEVAKDAFVFYLNAPGIHEAMAATLEKYVPIIAAEIVKENERLKSELSRYREPSAEVIERASEAWQRADTFVRGVRAVLAAVREG